MPRTTTWLSGTDYARWKASGVPLAELVRRGLDLLDGQIALVTPPASRVMPSPVRTAETRQIPPVEALAGQEQEARHPHPLGSPRGDGSRYCRECRSWLARSPDPG